MRKIKILLTFLFCNQLLFAHSDFSQFKQYNNVITRVISGFDFEEVHKVKIIGQMARDLCDSLNYTEPIIIDFKHAYTSPIKSTYFLGVDNWDDNQNLKSFRFVDRNIVITEHGYSFNFEKTLKLVEYAISNKREIIKNQKRIETEVRYSKFDLKTISIKITEAIVESKTSLLINTILSNKYYREKDIKRPYIKCYWSEGVYHFEARRFDKPDTLIFRTQSIYSAQFFDESAFIYTTDSNVVFINGLSPFTSKQHLIENKSQIFKYRPIKFVRINRYNYACSQGYYDSNAKTRKESFKLRSRTLYYQVEKDRLIQNLEAIIK